MTDILPVTPAERLKTEKQVFYITLDKYKQCLRKFASTQNKNDNAACNSYEKKLNNIIDHDMVLLKNNISKDINNMNSNVHQFVKNIDKSKKKYTFYNDKKNQFATEEELASDPHRYELFQIKLWRFVVLAYYFFGIIALMYFFKNHGKEFRFADKISNSIYNFRNMFTTLVS